MKKYFLPLFFLFCFFTGISAEAQQLTRFAVVDLPRVYMAFFRESRAVRDFEERSARVQSDIDRMTAEIQNLRIQMVNAQAQGNVEYAFRIETEINRRSDFLKEYYKTKTAELDAIKNNLSQSDAFFEQVYDEIRYVAESDGYSMVLNLKENNSILWYSPTTDVTDKVIKNLMDKSGR